MPRVLLRRPTTDATPAGRPPKWRAGRHRPARPSPPRTTCFLPGGPDWLLDALSPREPVVRTLRSALATLDRHRAAAGRASLGRLTERVADRQHVNVLAFPLLALIAWNLAVYGLLLLRPLFGRHRPGRRWLRNLGPRSTSDAWRWSRPRRAASSATGPDSVAAARRARRPRAASGGGALAVGALLGLYLRALAFEYRIGWESTFLDASTVHAILSTLLDPAARLLGCAVPSVEAIEAMRISGRPRRHRRGPWIHLMRSRSVWCDRAAAGAGRVVALARTVGSRPTFRWTSAKPYFRRLLTTFNDASSAESARAAVQLHAGRGCGRRSGAIARHLFGDATTQLALRPSTGVGAEDAAAPGPAAAREDVPLMLAVFNAATTPEQENHGRFLDALGVRPTRRWRSWSALEPSRDASGRRPEPAIDCRNAVTPWQAFAADRELAAVCIDVSTPPSSDGARPSFYQHSDERHDPRPPRPHPPSSWILVSHTNSGKTTLARTLLGRDIGVVRDAPHVTEIAEVHRLLESPRGTSCAWGYPRIWGSDTAGASGCDRPTTRSAGCCVKSGIGIAIARPGAVSRRCVRTRVGRCHPLPA